MQNLFLHSTFREFLLISYEVFLPRSILESVNPDFSRFGEDVLSKTVLDWVTDAERNVPYLKGGGRDAFGRRASELIVSEGWKRLQNFGIQNGYGRCSKNGVHIC